MRRALLLPLVVGGVLLAGCSGPEAADESVPTPPPALVRIGEPGVDRSPFRATYGSATSAGSDLVVVELGSARQATALRRADGTWWELPDLPFAGYIQLASANDRAVAGGIACTDRDCTDGELAFAMLSDDRSEWKELDGAPGLSASPTETELTTGPGLSEFADFNVLGGYRVDEDGNVSQWERSSLRLPGAGFDTGR